MSKNNGTVIRPYTHKELSSMYGVSWVTFKKWLRPFLHELGHKNGHFYNTRQVEIIFFKLGFPQIQPGDHEDVSVIA